MCRILPAVLSAMCAATLGCRALDCGKCCDPCGGFGAAGWFSCSPHAGEKYKCGCNYCDPTRGCGPGCDCSTVCACGQPCCKAGNCNGWDDPCNRQPARWPWLNKICGCTGCGDYYFCEWWCDPPACDDPCDCLGNYVGPGSVGYYRAPYRRSEMIPMATETQAPVIEAAPSEPIEAPAASLHRSTDGKLTLPASTAVFIE